MSDNGFRFGDWQIDPDSNTLRNGEASATVEPKAMDVLRYLCRHAGAVIPPEELLQACWGNAELGDNPIHKAITQLRRALGDSASEPRYIETVRKRGYRAIAPVMAGEAALEGSWQQGSPFRGLESFQESHAAIFFGRMQATAQLRELVLKQTSDGCAMALVLGPSGSGKTSLVRAGLLPGLMASRTGSGEPVALACTLYMDCADLADGNLFQALAAVLMDAEVGGKLLFSGENAEGLGRWLESSDAAAITGRLSEASGRIKIGLFVDRLEAIFRAPGVTDEIRSRFIAVLEHLASSRAVLVMLACRNDFYPEVIALPALMALKSRGGHFDLNPPDGAEIAQMVRMPAKAAGLKFEVDAATGASLDDVLCDAARGSPDTLPLLQYCLDELYRQRAEDGTLKYSVFKQLGNIEGAIAVRAEQAVAAMRPEHIAVLPRILSLIVDVTEDQTTSRARRVPWSALENEDAREVVQTLVNARLFVSELAVGTPCFCVAHEALLRRWPRVADWVEQHRAALQICSRISRDTVRWKSAGKARDLLLPQGTQVNQAKDLLDSQVFSLPAAEKEYITKSWSRARLMERLKVGVVAVVAGLAVLAAVLGYFAHQAQLDAEQHRAEAEGLLGYMLGEFAEKLRPLGKLDLLNDISNQALQYLAKPTTANFDQTTALHRAKALNVLAEVNINQSDIKKASQALNSARNILKQHYTDGTNDHFEKELASNSSLLGQISLGSSNFPDAEQYLNDYKLHSEHLGKLTGNSVIAISELSYAYGNLGTVSLKQRKIEAAADLFSKSVALRKSALQRKPNDPRLLGDLANGLSWQADVEAKLGRLEHAISLHEYEEKILREILLSNSADFKWDHQIANSLWHQGELQLALGNTINGKRNLSESERLFEKIVSRDPSNKTWKVNLYTVRLRLYENSIEISNKNNLNLQFALLKEIDELRATDPSRAKFSQLLAWAHQGIAENQLELGNFSEALKHADEALSILRNIKKSSKPDIQYSIRLSNSLLLLSEINRRNNNSGKAKALCGNSKEALADIDRNTYDYYALIPLVISYSCSGEPELVTNERQRLEDMKFRSSRLLKYLPPPPQLKGKL